MYITTDIFFWVTGLEIAILLGLLIPILIQIMGLRGDIKPVASSIKQADNFFRVRGLSSLLSPHKAQESDKGHHSLLPEKAERRDLLIAKGKREGLTKVEADELRQLLLEDARDEFRTGNISPFALGTISTSTGDIVETFSKEAIPEVSGVEAFKRAIEAAEKVAKLLGKEEKEKEEKEEQKKEKEEQI